MKNFVIAFSLLLSLPAFAAETRAERILQARDVSAVLLSPFHADLFADTMLDEGSLTINKTAKTLSIAFPYSNHCLPGRLCAMFVRAPLVIELPLVSVRKNECNATVYVAKKDRRPVDGSLEVLTVVDHSKDTCKYLVAVPSTEIDYETRNPRSATPAVSKFKAELLEAQY